MKNHEQLAQEICDSVESDTRVVAAKKKLEGYDGKASKAWREVFEKRMGGASFEVTRREIIPLEIKRLKLKTRTFNLMKKVFKENKDSYRLPKDADFLDFFLHPLNDKVLMGTIENLIKHYEMIGVYSQRFKYLAKKMEAAGFKFINLNGQKLATLNRPRGLLSLEKSDKFVIALIISSVEIERIKVCIELSALDFSDLGKRYLDLLKILPPTKITKELTSFFESLEKIQETNSCSLIPVSNEKCQIR